MLAYWARATKRAWKDTISMLGFPHSSRLIVTTTMFALAIILLALWGQLQQLFEELRWGIVIALAVGIVFLPLFILNLLAAPTRMEREALERAQQRESHLQEEILVLRGQLEPRTQRRQIRESLGLFINQGHAL